MEKAILKIDNLKISQGMNGDYSHNGDLAIDLCDLKYFKAPFTGKIKKIYKKCNGVWLQSINKVEFADGTIDYMTIMTLHDNDISKLKVGQTIKQGETYYHAGTKGKVTGKHIHMAVGRGKYKLNGWYKGKYQPKAKAYAWLIYNQYNVVDALFLDKSVKKTKAMYKWVNPSENAVKTQNSTTSTVKYYKKPAYEGVSIVDALKDINVNSSFANRAKIAKKNGIKVYVSSAKQNLKMLKLLKQGKLIKP